MIQYLKRSLTLGDNSEELLSEESGGLPFLCYFDESRLFTGNHIPWHLSGFTLRMWSVRQGRGKWFLSTGTSCMLMISLHR